MNRPVKKITGFFIQFFIEKKNFYLILQKINKNFKKNIFE